MLNSKHCFFAQYLELGQHPETLDEVGETPYENLSEVANPIKN